LTCTAISGVYVLEIWLEYEPLEELMEDNKGRENDE
jgi:hypothetical protein